MKCPKCHYISFDAGERCRNCGYEFSLSVDLSELDLPIQSGKEPEGPLSDFQLGDSGAADPVRRAEPAESQPRARSTGFDLPLFKGPLADDAPLVTPPAAPRAPLSVRKGTPAISRPAQRPRVPDPEPELDLEVPEPSALAERTPTDAAAEPETDDAVTASLGRRFGAALIDVVILGAVDLAVLYFTMRLCGLGLAEIPLIPAVPFLGFLFMQNAGYFAAFVAAGGQTIGKMAFGIKVVPAAADGDWPDRVRLGTAVLRAVAWFPSVLPAGIGLLPALLGPDRRAAHDRLAGTRVVRA